MKPIEIKDVAEFVEHVGSLKALTGSVIFCGQSRKGNLLPSVARQNPSTDITSLERTTLEMFRNHGLTKFPGHVDIKNEWDLLVLAQHYGLKTRLLDWTHNALAALWFAVSGRGSDDCYVYMLDARSLILKTLDEGPFTQRKTRVVTPNLSNDRIIAQSGCFTAHRFSDSSGKFVPLERNPEIKKHLTEYAVRGANKVDFLMALELCGVSSKSIYPDINGLCQFLNWRAEGSY